MNIENKENELKELRADFIDKANKLKDYSGIIVGLSRHLRIGDGNFESTHRVLGYINIQIKQISKKFDEIEKQLIIAKLHKQ